ncbi:MAG: tetratricopeptide repeat protein [Desulfosudis oleivorans]|nr:tetratricopeptide repeat protein [Desulfosudis oleivorans]
MEPENAVAHHDLGVLLYKSQSSDEAITHLEEALRLNNDFPNAMLELRQALYEAGKAAGGKEEYTAGQCVPAEACRAAASASGKQEYARLG